MKYILLISLLIMSNLSWSAIVIDGIIEKGTYIRFDSFSRDKREFPLESYMSINHTEIKIYKKGKFCKRIHVNFMLNLKNIDKKEFTLERNYTFSLNILFDFVNYKYKSQNFIIRGFSVRSIKPEAFITVYDNQNEYFDLLMVRTLENSSSIDNVFIVTAKDVPIKIKID